MKVAIGCDHGGYNLKPVLKDFLESKGIEYKDFGTNAPDSVDYNEFGLAVANAVANGEFDKGIIICGTGIGMSIMANKIKGIRAACCSDYFSAKYTRLHNNANALCLGGRVVGAGLAIELVDVFLNTEFEGGRHERRVNQIAELENL